LGRITPYTKVPKIAAKITTMMGRNPAPKLEYIGPGQAPEMAQPPPKIIPPNK
jgi:hypothetical protein